jgi:threonine dehydrogenase-like Zn-dependent dehydrogenase
MESGDILGHENMGEVIELGSEVKSLKKGDHVVVPFTISCGECWFCQACSPAAIEPIPMLKSLALWVNHRRAVWIQP